MDKYNEKLLKEFIEYFSDGYMFEEFCKFLLQDLGFDDVKVTKRSGDNGIDLECIKEEIDVLDINPTEYVVQAKKYSLSNKVGSGDMRNFKGTIDKRRKIFITTSTFTTSAIQEANDTSLPVILVDGYKIIEFYIKKRGEMFEFSPVFSKSKMDDIFIKRNKEPTIKNDEKTIITNINTIQKKIQKNDIRARILPIPSEIFNKIKENDSYKVRINEEDNILNINKQRKYFGGITKYYKNLGYIANENFIYTIADWYFDEVKKIIFVNFK